MLHKLTLKGFAVHRHREIEFPNGLTSIVGANGVGKSLIVEAIRYALFGTAALRGDHPEKVVLEFSVRGVRYRVTRSQRDAKVEEVEGATLAVGTKPTNQRVVELFGYGLDVFDVANCANQGLIEALSNMKPAERKRMIETTIGVDALEKLLEFTRKEASGATKEADALARGLGVAPECPEAPSDARSEAELVSEVQSLERNVESLRDAERNLAQQPPSVVRERPFVLELDLSRSSLEDYRNAAANAARARLNLQAMKDRHNATRVALAKAGGLSDYNDEGLKTLGLYLSAAAVVDANPEPSHTLELCAEQEQLHDDLAEFERWQKLHASGQHECPACQHTWPVQSDALAKLRDWHGKAAPSPTMTRAQIARLRSEIAAFEKDRPRVEEAAQTMFSLLSTHPYLRKITQAEFENQQKRRELEKASDTLFTGIVAEERHAQSCETLARLYGLHNEGQAELASWEAAKAKSDEWEARADHWRFEVRRCAEAPSLLATTRAALMERRVCDRLHAAWETAMAGRAEREAEIASLRLRAEQWKEASAAIGEVRQQIESHLVPGLAALSSMLVSRMTGGRRQTVTIDPGFALSLDNQDVNTLSGSEKAAVNLALRIALGRMLTSRVFSVLILDEPDAAMDDERAASTAECLRSLCPEIAQVILVTHKQIETDAQVVLN